MIRPVLISLLVLIACSNEPKQINYGHDSCHYCQMIIVDQNHGAQMVTKTGKAYLYDATECMMQHLASWEGPLVSQVLVTDYSTPGSLINARSAQFLFSKHIPSPMGAFLSSFPDHNHLAEHAQPGDRIVNWSKLSEQYKVKSEIFNTVENE